MAATERVYTICEQRKHLLKAAPTYQLSCAGRSITWCTAAGLYAVSSGGRNVPHAAAADCDALRLRAVVTGTGRGQLLADLECYSFSNSPRRAGLLRQGAGAQNLSRQSSNANGIESSVNLAQGTCSTCNG